MWNFIIFFFNKQIFFQECDKVYTLSLYLDLVQGALVDSFSSEFEVEVKNVGKKYNLILISNNDVWKLLNFIKDFVKKIDPIKKTVISYSYDHVKNYKFSNLLTSKKYTHDLFGWFIVSIQQCGHYFDESILAYVKLRSIFKEFTNIDILNYLPLLFKIYYIYDNDEEDEKFYTPELSITKREEFEDYESQIKMSAFILNLYIDNPDVLQILNEKWNWEYIQTSNWESLIYDEFDSDNSYMSYMKYCFNRYQNIEHHVIELEKNNQLDEDQLHQLNFLMLFNEE